MANPVAVPVVLTDDEREQLQGWARRPSGAPALVMRSRIILACEGYSSNTQIARQLGVTRGMVAKWRNRFAADRVEGLLCEARPGRPRVVGDDRIEALITATLETTPPDGTRWTTRSMAAHLGLSQSMVSRVWRAFGLVPHKQDSWKLSTQTSVRQLNTNIRTSNQSWNDNPRPYVWTKPPTNPRIRRRLLQPN